MKIKDLIDCIHLQRLEYINREEDMLREASEVSLAVQNMPISLRELEIGVSSLLANETLVNIAIYLPNLEFLSLKLSDLSGILPADISLETMERLHSGCPLLSTLEISGSVVGIEVAAFLFLQHFLYLRKIKLLYDEDIIDALCMLLYKAEYLDEIIFYEDIRSKLYCMKKREGMCQAICHHISSQY